MKVSKKTWIIGSAAAALGFCLYVFDPDDSFSLPPASDQAVAANDLASYEAVVTLRQTNEGQGESLALLLRGELEQSLDPNGVYRTQWTRIDSFTLLGDDAGAASEALQAGPVTSIFDPQTLRFEHAAAEASVEALQKIQANILNKILLPFAPGSTPDLNGERREEDDLGSYRATYATHTSGGETTVVKRWLAYTNDKIEIDQSGDADRFSYRLGSSHRLIEVEGKLGVIVNDTHYTTSISLRLRGSRSAPQLLTQQKKSSLKPIDTSAGASNVIESELSYEESLQHLDALTAESPSAEAYRIFSSIKQDLIVHPEHGDEIAARLAATSGRDASTKRRMATLFGALAQSNSSHHADLLADLATQCPDAYCKSQALMGVSDHKFPTEQAAAQVLQIAAVKGDTFVQETALLAAGSMGQKLDAKLPELPALLKAKLSDPSLSEMKSTVIAAMGNHGSATYLPLLKEQLAAKDVSERAAAAYSLRHVPGAESLLLDTLRPDQDKNVLAETYKALEYRDLSPGEYQDLAKKSLEFKDQDLQLAAARNLVRAFERNPEMLKESLETLKSQTEFPGVRAYIISETAAH